MRAFLAALLVSAALVVFSPSHSQAAQIDPLVTTYVVQRYDTLKGIAARYGVSMQTILNLNNIPDPDSLEIESVLMIPLWDFVQPPAVPPAELAALETAPAANTYSAIEEPSAVASADDLVRPSNAVSARGGRQADSGVVWPVSGPMTTLFMEDGRHKGIDIAAPQGTPVVSIKSGTVRFSGEDNSGYGRYVIVDHPDGSSALYAHFTRREVSAGEEVRQGQVVGYVGATGIATGPHLHFEVRQDGNLVDPLGVLP